MIGLEIGSDKLTTILKHIIDIYSGSRTAVIIDDMGDSNEQHNNHNMLYYVGYSGRHHNFSRFILSQKLNSISTGIINNAIRVVFLKRTIKAVSKY